MPEGSLWPVSIKGVVFVNEHKDVRLFALSELRQIPIPELYIKAVTLAQASQGLQTNA